MPPFTRRTVVSNTGPLISAFQSNRVEILPQLYDVIIIADSELAEFKKHGAAQEIDKLIDVEAVVVHALTDSEKAIAKEIAEAIAKSRQTKDRIASHHYPEAEAMVLMSRPSLFAQELLLDELAARVIAQSRGIPVIGFAGVLIRASQSSLLSAEEVRETLTLCQKRGTHYSASFVAEVYRRLKEGAK